QMDGWPDAGDSYSVTSIRPHVSARDLEAVGVSAESAQLAALPDVTIPQIIQDTARKWTLGMTNDFDRVEAIREHLSTEFIYDKGVSYTDDPQSLADMLQTTHRGFCQQFASLMA